MRSAIGAAICLSLAFPVGARGATFSSTGSEQTLRVPAGVTSLPVTAVGGEGSAEGVRAGGRAGTAAGTLAVTPGQILYIEVGGTGAGSGFNGGGASGSTFPVTTGGGGGA